MKNIRITKDVQIKLRRQADRKLRLERNTFIRTGPHQTYKDKPRQNTVKPAEFEN